MRSSYRPTKIECVTDERPVDIEFKIGILRGRYLQATHSLRDYEQGGFGVLIWKLIDDLLALPRIEFDFHPAGSSELEPDSEAQQTSLDHCWQC